ncbi:MAG: hypothetical protein IAE79_13910 [Anaerolinea sp.]|nr:hypothetical protein [Anaerolinea sp.]
MNTIANQEYEQTLNQIVRSLPPNRAEQLVEFARFLEAQILSEALIQEKELAEIEADNERWDTLLDTNAGQYLLEKLADEALAGHTAGKTKPMAVNNRGQIVPG